MLKALLGYVAMLFGAIALFLIVRSMGEALDAPAPMPFSPSSGAGAAATGSPNALFHVLLALAAVVLMGRLLGGLLRALGQPPVIGEVLGGILLGPSLLGRVAPDVSAFVLPPSVAPSLGVVAQLGVVLYMFLIGLELNGDLLRRRARATVAVSHASIVVPFVLGSLLALYLYPRLGTSNVAFTTFALFMAVAMSITAFPVLARILSDRGATRTELGASALTCAAIDDVTAWCLLAFVVAVAKSDARSIISVLVLTGAFIGAMFLAVRPLLIRRLARSDDHAPPTREAFGLILVGVLLSALATELAGIHAIFGAFLFGVIIPHDSGLARALRDKLHDLVTILLLPAYFAFTGMRTQIGLVSGASDWLLCGLIILVATAGKFGGALVAARVTGLKWKHSVGLGILMNTRGLMELIVLNVGLDLGAISPALYAMLVMMALVTTLATSPLLSLLGVASANELQSGLDRPSAVRLQRPAKAAES
jgi:Kef-type K+ transport system membrane component KefB